MTFEEYEKDVFRTVDMTEDFDKLLATKAMGLSGEANEFLEIVKKYLEQGVPLNREHLASELGDLLWYLVVCLRLIGYSIFDIMKINVAKRLKRYPKGFSTERSINRAKDDI